MAQAAARVARSHGSPTQLAAPVIGGIVYLFSGKVRRAHGVASAGSPG